MPKVLYYINTFPQLSQTYVWVELQRVSHRMGTDLIAMRRGIDGFEESPPSKVMSDVQGVIDYVRQTKPDVLHSHWLYMAESIFEVAKATDTPFTIRAHSFDTLPLIQDIRSKPTICATLQWIRSHWLGDIGKGFLSTSPWYLYKIAHIINHPLCLGILSFPFSRKNLETAGFNSQKITDCYPVVDFQRFYSKAENGDGVMLCGIFKRKKNMKSYLRLAKMLPERQFNLHVVGSTMALESFNQSMGGLVDINVNIKTNTPFYSMPSEYKKNQWLIIPSEGHLSTSGWPMITAEAQAAGVIVCMQNSRPDLKAYLGEAGYLFNSLDEVCNLIRQSPPLMKRESGFAQAKKSDIDEHLKLLFNLWKPVFKYDSF